jgi:hypothetical protein
MPEFRKSDLISSDVLAQGGSGLATDGSAGRAAPTRLREVMLAVTPFCPNDGFPVASSTGRHQVSVTLAASQIYSRCQKPGIAFGPLLPVEV